jgi:hypothetical protein
VNLTTRAATNIFGGAVGGISNIQSFIGPIGQTNSLIGPNMNNTWSINGSDSGTLNGGAFSNFKNITGGPQEDSFVFVPTGVITGILDGGTGTNTLRGANQDTVWNITGLGAGILSTTAGSTIFQNIQYAVGGSANDRFVFSNGAMFYFVDGGGNSPEVNTLDYSLFTTPVIIYPFSDTSSNLVSGFAHIQLIVGNFIFYQPEIKYAIVENYLALNQINTFLNGFSPLDNFLYYTHDLKDTELLNNLFSKNGKILYLLYREERQVNNNVFEELTVFEEFMKEQSKKSIFQKIKKKIF